MGNRLVVTRSRTRVVHVVCSGFIGAAVKVTTVTTFLGGDNCGGGLHRGGAVRNFSASFIGNILSGPVCYNGLTFNEEGGRGVPKAEGRCRVMGRGSCLLDSKIRRTVVSRRV